MEPTSTNNSLFTSFATEKMIFILEKGLPSLRMIQLFNNEAGAVAGLTVDLSLFPLDTIKTRLQSKQGFIKAGGFKGIYKGVGPAALGSAPCAAIFFVTYDGIKEFLHPLLGENWFPLCHMVGALVAETAVNIVKVPIEIVKQRRQTSHGISPLAIARLAIHQEGYYGLYRGFASTVIRDIPFSVIQFPLWEAMKAHWSLAQDEEVSPAISAFCGATAGAVAGALTTPLDVAKTRVMLAEHSIGKKDQLKMAFVLQDIYRINGLRGLYAGLVPRTAMIFLGGAVFFGSYDYAREHFIKFNHEQKENS